MLFGVVGTGADCPKGVKLMIPVEIYLDIIEKLQAAAKPHLHN